MADKQDRETERLVEIILERARNILEGNGPRPPGSPGEKKTIDDCERILQRIPGMTSRRESFLFAPLAFFSMQKISAVFSLLALISYWLSPFLTLALGLCAVLIQYFQLFRYRRFLDPFFPKGQSENLWATLDPRLETRQTLILNSHPDAAYEWRWHRLFPGFFSLLVLFMLFCLCLTPIAGLIGLWAQYSGNQPLWILCGLILTGFYPAFCLAFGFNDLKVVSPGANDNLSGVFLSLGLFERFSEISNRPSYTRLIFLLTGSEEAGLRGAKAWAKIHSSEFDHQTTRVITLDTIRDLDHLKIYSRDMNGTVVHDPKICLWLQDAGQKMGRKIPQGSIFLGASDAAAMTQAGFRCATIAAMDPAPAFYYHTRYDTPENMNPECLRVVAELITQAVKDWDLESSSPSGQNESIGKG